MLHAISWSIFLISIACLALAYWLVISLIFYSRELRSLINGKNGISRKQESKSTEPMFVSNTGAIQGPSGFPVESGLVSGQDNDEKESSGLFPVAYRLVDELKEIIADQTNKKSAKEELLYAIQRTLNKEEYVRLKHTAFQVAINNLIEGECLSKGGINLTVEELGFVWKK